MEEIIRAKLDADLLPELLNIENESHMHGGSATDSHFNLTAVSSQFSGLSPVKRHQRIYKLLAEEMAGEVHALALHLYTPEEWQERSQPAPASPDCRGGSKHEQG
jgi:BolA family transcriptional regulator, general stress-responsive regulator